MAVPSIQTSFAAGELAPSLFGHVDFNKFVVGAATMRNMFVSWRGGSYSRPGTAFVGFSKQVNGNTSRGTLTYSTLPTAGDTITLNGYLFTYVSGAPAAHQLRIQGSVAGQVSFDSSVIAGLSDPLLIPATYTSNSNQIIITYKVPGTVGNSYTLAKSSTAITASGPTLSGGGAFAPRLITFQFSINQGLALEFGNFYMRVVSDGAFVTETAKAITAITQANPGVVTAVAHGWTTGDWIFISGVVGMTQVNGQTYVITVVDANNVSLQDVFGNNINTSTFTAYVSGGTAARIFTLVTPYSAADIYYIKFTQSADVMSLCCRNQMSGAEYPPYELSRFADDNWTLTPLSTGSSIAAPASMSGVATVTTSLTGITDYQYVSTAVDFNSGQESVASPIANIPNSVDISSTAGSIILNWAAVPGARYYNVYKAPAAFQATVPVGSLFGFAGSTYGNQFVDSNIIADESQVPPLHANPFLPGQLLGVTVTSQGSGLGGINYVINTVTGSGAHGYGIVVGGAMQAFVFDNPGGNYAASDTITFSDSAGVAATGTLTYSGLPTVGDTITLNGYLYTYVAGFPAAHQLRIQGSIAGQVSFDSAVLAANSDPLLTVATYGSNATQILITYKTTGTAGNAYTLAKSSAVIALSAATLTGGAGGTSPTGTLIIGPQSGTYPAVVAYFQERRVYGNTANQPDTYFMSQPGSFSNFDSRTPTIDSDAIEGTPWSVQVDGIQFMLPILGGLVVLTGQAAYQVVGNGGSPTNPQPVTPSSQQALPQAYNGCNQTVPPIKIDYDVLYLQAKGSIIRSLAYNFWINVFTGVDITYLSSHLFFNYTLTAMAWCEEPFKLMWCIRNDGVMLSLTSLKSQDIEGWARHDTQGAFVSATSVTEPPVDALYVATQRYLPSGNAPFMIERMDNRSWPTVEECWCVDAGLELPQTEPQSVMGVSSSTGLGQPVAILISNGGQNYSAATYATIIDMTGNGTGCVATPVIVSGVIIGVTLSGGTGYLEPQIQVTDPASNGTGFQATIQLDNTATVLAAPGPFNSGMVGWVIRAGGGVMQITAYTSSINVTVAMVSPVTEVIPNTGGQVGFFQPGEWTLSQPVTKITGLNHLVGMTVTGLADGIVIPPSVVAADGSITLANAASAVIVGLGFTAQLQSLYLEGGNPTVQGRRKKIGAVTTRLEASGTFSSGTNQPDGSVQNPQQVAPSWTKMVAAPTNATGLAQVPYLAQNTIRGVTMQRATPLYTGDIRTKPTSGFQKNGQVAVQQTNPLPLQVLAFIREVEEGDSPEGVPQPPQRGGRNGPS